MCRICTHRLGKLWILDFASIYYLYFILYLGYKAGRLEPETNVFENKQTTGYTVADASIIVYYHVYFNNAACSLITAT